MKNDTPAAPPRSMNIIKFLAPFFIVLIIAVFVANIITHGSIQHPGKSVYESKCAMCHGKDGEGIKVLVPPLMEADFALQNFDSIPCWLQNGITRQITVNGTPYEQNMYGIELDEVQMANVINYISRDLLKSDRRINSEWVKTQLKQCK
ncbi:MAG: cytochrome c [Chitinophagales bacterium]